MYEVTCGHCGRIVKITPDAPRCTTCGEQLGALIPPEYASSYFYRRAAELAARGDVDSALAEAERGIHFHESSELRLLAAIVAKRIGNEDSMRGHVAAIPVDDRLRHEAEWLLRSQQSRRAAPRQSQRQAAASLSAPTAEQLSLPANGMNFALATASAQQPTSVWVQRFWGAVALLLLLVVGSMGWVLLSGGPDALIALLTGQSALSVDGNSGQNDADGQSAALLPTPTPRLTPAAEGDLVLQPVATVPLAALSTDADAAQADQENFDKALEAAGRTDLKELGLSVVQQNGSLVLNGVVPSFADQNTVIELAQAMPGVTDVSAAELVVRLPATYTVQAGDTLWSIAYRFYGEDASRVDALFAANQEQLPAPDALNVGMVLTLPSND